MPPISTVHASGVVLLMTALAGCSDNQLENVLDSGELKVLTRSAASTYYEGPDGPSGLEFDLSRGFAENLGVDLKMMPRATVAEVMNGLRRNHAHFAAAGLTITESRKQWVRFTPPYQQVTQQLVYKRGNVRPRSLDDVVGELVIIADSSHAERLNLLSQQHPLLAWHENAELESEDLMQQVSEQQLDYTIADSNELQINQRFYPELRAAFDLSEPEELAWAFPRDDDDSLFRLASAYIRQIRENGTLERLMERHYGHVDDFDYVGTRTYMRHIQARLPHFQEWIEEAALEQELDWRLLAAMAYQESHWDPKAVSPTGVRGFMMLTQATAEYLGIEKRTDPLQSIKGGARYFRKLYDKVPERIHEPDRTWMAVAAYNIGYGHLNDARIITEFNGGDPDAWHDVKENLPLLRQRKWYGSTKHGYARGDEAATYVENIRTYYDILKWLTEDRTGPLPLEDEPVEALTIINPVL